MFFSIIAVPIFLSTGFMMMFGSFFRFFSRFSSCDVDFSGVLFENGFDIVFYLFGEVFGEGVFVWFICGDEIWV